MTGSFVAGLDVAAAMKMMQSNFGGYERLLIVNGLGALVFILPLVFVAWLLTDSTTDLRQRLLASILLGMTLALLLLRPYGEFALNHLTGQVYLQAISRKPIS